MSKRFNKTLESPRDMKIRSFWIEGVQDVIENTKLPRSFDRTKETDVIIHGYLVDTSLPEIRDLAFTLKKVGNFIWADLKRVIQKNARDLS